MIRLYFLKKKKKKKQALAKQPSVTKDVYSSGQVSFTSNREYISGFSAMQRYVFTQ